jgi:3,4-dihydroxy 2-butanone 4-phosphate synthase/GTP cyclohydrolase II
MSTLKISPTEQIISEIRNGRMVILVDEEDRENEGDLVLEGSICNARTH